MKKIHSVFYVLLLKFYHDEVFNTTSSVRMIEQYSEQFTALMFCKKLSKKLEK